MIEFILGSFALTEWLVLVEVTLLRAALTGRSLGKWWWFHPGYLVSSSRVRAISSLTERFSG